jgi:hypothetical protein
MKRLVLLTVIFALCLSAIHAELAQAQSGRKYSFFVSGDLNLAVSPEVFTDYYDMGFGLTLGMEFPASPAWSFIGSIGYKNFGPSQSVIESWWTDPGEYPGATNIAVSEGALEALTIAILGKGMLKSEGSKVYPYAKGGFGITIGGADEIKVDFNDQGGAPRTEWVGGADQGTNFSVQIAVGVEFLLGSGGSALFADVGVALVSLDELSNPTIVPINVGFKF